MRGNIIKGLAATTAILFMITLLPVSNAYAAESSEAAEKMSTSVAGYGYGGECPIPVIPPWHGFSVSATPIQRSWWEWWRTPQVRLDLNGGSAYWVVVSNSSNMSGGIKMRYSSSVNWDVLNSWQQGWKKVYVQYQSFCGNKSPVVSTSYYYWGW